MNNLDNYNFSDLNPNSQRAFLAIIAGFYASAAWFAKGTNIPLQIAEREFARSNIIFSHSISEPAITALLRAIDRDEISLFSDQMSETIWTWGKNAEIDTDE
jgi:hypothetical protein